jgi:chromosome segregation ATPase
VGLIKAHEDSIQSLDSQVRECRRELDSLGSSLQSEIALRQKAQTEAESLVQRVAELSGQLAEKAADQQRWQECQSELEECVRQQKADLAISTTTAADREMELQHLRSELDDLHIIQTAMCSHVRELTTQRDRAFRQIHELNAEFPVSVPA